MDKTPPTGFTPGHPRIVVCRRCDGRGHFDRLEPLDGHGKEIRQQKETCTCCKGSGRMVLTVTLVPFKP